MALNEHFLQELLSIFPDLQSIDGEVQLGNTFKKIVRPPVRGDSNFFQAAFLKLYGVYCATYKKTLEYAEQLTKKNAGFAKHQAVSVKSPAL